MGFGFVEIGTVTPKPQYGNPKPRVHRIESKESLLNSLGFPNDGVEIIKKRLEITRDECIGINIGPNKDTKFQHLINDYLTCYDQIYEYCDFITINISSPNTPELRDLHNPIEFKKIIDALLARRAELEYRPRIFIKFSPDESFETYKQLIEVINDSEIDGVIVTNTTNNLTIKKKLNIDNLAGGVSGRLLQKTSNEILKIVEANLSKEKIIVAVGGVYDVDSYNEKIDLGADLVQIYTGLIYEGPDLVKRILKNGKQISSNS